MAVIFQIYETYMKFLSKLSESLTFWKGLKCLVKGESINDKGGLFQVYDRGYKRKSPRRRGLKGYQK
ncbi:MAG: hypothetical protein KBT75_09130 [Oleispira antarctica]|nr:hypothetical protein [Oleispira antarctica]MBQ0792583.1 hypothetical protein [Oleispira antarctica]